MLTSEVTIKSLEADVDKLEQDRIQAAVLRDKKEDDQIDTQVVINYLKYYMEHLHELILGSVNPLQNGAMFGLLFDDPPTYDVLNNGTPKLASIYQIIDQKDLSARSERLELSTVSSAS